MLVQMQTRRGDAAEWTAENPVLADGEMGFEEDTNRVKFGNGAAVWAALPYFLDEEAVITTGDARYVVTLDAAGAKGNDTGDDAAAITAAMNGLVGFGGGSVIARANGTYRINSTLVIPTGVTLDMNGATLRCGSAPTGALLDRGRHISMPSTTTRGAFKNFRFGSPVTAPTMGVSERAYIHVQGNACTVDNGYSTMQLGISPNWADFAMFKAGSYNKIVNCHVVNAGITYAYGGSQYNVCKNNTIIDPPSNGLSGVGNTTTMCLGNKVVHNTVIRAGRFGLEDHGTASANVVRNTLIQGNHFIDSVAMGMSAVGEGCRVKDNTIVNPGSYGIECVASGNDVSGNTIRWDAPSTFAGIAFNSTPANGYDGAICSDNTIVNAGVAIQTINGGTRTQIVNNNIHGWGTCGIQMVADTLAQGNTMIQTTAGAGNIYGIQMGSGCKVIMNTLLYSVVGVQVPFKWNSAALDTLLVGNTVDGGGVAHSSGTGSPSAGVVGVTLRDNNNRNGATFSSQGMTGIVPENLIGSWGTLRSASDSKIGVLARSGNLSAIVAGVTALYTVPTGRTAIITGALVRCNGRSGTGAPPTLGIGIAAGEDDIFPSTSLATVVTTGRTHLFVSSGGMRENAAGAVINLGIDVAATYTSQSIVVDLLGYLI